MRLINSDTVTDVVSKMCTEANHILPHDVCNAINKALESEKSPTGINILKDIVKNYTVAENDREFDT